MERMSDAALGGPNAPLADGSPSCRSSTPRILAARAIVGRSPSRERIKDYILNVTARDPRPEHGEPRRPKDMSRPRRLAPRVDFALNIAARARTVSCGTAATSRRKTSRPWGRRAAAPPDSTYEAEAEEITTDSSCAASSTRWKVP